MSARSFAIAGLALAVLLSGAVSPSVVGVPVASADGPGFHKRQLLALLLSKRGFPTRVQLLRIGPSEETNRLLVEIAGDIQTQLVLQLNAIRALEYFPTKRTEEVLMTMLFARGQSVSHKRTILRSLARTFGVRMYFEVVPFLRDLEPKVRAGAALALGEIDDGRVRSMLTNMLESEPEISVRLAIEQGLALVTARERAEAGDPRPVGTPLD